jgi:hypothetical protein
VPKITAMFNRPSTVFYLLIRLEVSECVAGLGILVWGLEQQV